MVNKKINWKTIAMALIIVLISFFAILLIDKFWTSESAWKSPLLAFIGAIQTTVLAVAVWDFIAKKDFAKEILDLAEVSSNISETGVTHVYDDFLNINWTDILQRTTKLTIAVLYSNTWRESNRIYLAKIATNQALVVYLPDYKSKEVLRELACRLNMNDDEVLENIKKSEKGFKDLGASVFLFKGSFQSSYYLTENEAVLAVFNHKREKLTVPAIQMNKSGSLYNYVKTELEAIADYLSKESEQYEK